MSAAAAGAAPIVEEAGRLLTALEDWVRSGGLSQNWGEHLAGGLHEGMSWLGDSIGGSQECRVCPLCQLLALVRGGQPEVWQHLGAALGNLADAVKSAVDSVGNPDHARPTVQRIDVL